MILNPEARRSNCCYAMLIDWRSTKAASSKIRSRLKCRSLSVPPQILEEPSGVKNGIIEAGRFELLVDFCLDWKDYQTSAVAYNASSRTIKVCNLGVMLNFWILGVECLGSVGGAREGAELSSKLSVAVRISL